MTQGAKAERFMRLASAHLEAAHNLALWLTGNRSDAEDLTQDAFLRAFRFSDQLRGESAKPWLLKIVRNTHYSRLRNVRFMLRSTTFDDAAGEAEQTPADGNPADDPEDALLRVENDELIRAAMRALPADQRAILVLREVEDMTYNEIAVALDIPIGTVMSRLGRARKLLADRVKNMDQEAAHATRRS